MFNNSFFALFLILLQCLVWMRLINLLTSKKPISSSVSRNLLHLETGPLSLSGWLLQAAKNMARNLATFVPLLSDSCSSRRTLEESITPSDYNNLSGLANSLLLSTQLL